MESRIFFGIRVCILSVLVNDFERKTGWSSWLGVCGQDIFWKNWEWHLSFLVPNSVISAKWLLSEPRTPVFVLLLIWLFLLFFFFAFTFDYFKKKKWSLFERMGDNETGDIERKMCCIFLSIALNGSSSGWARAQIRYWYYRQWLYIPKYWPLFYTTFSWVVTLFSSYI